MICAIPLMVNDGKTFLWSKIHVDHDHETGLVRGILCNRCNTMLGKYEMYLDSQERVANYLSLEEPTREHLVVVSRPNKSLCNRARALAVNYSVVEAVWSRCGGRCEVCGVMISIDGGSGNSDGSLVASCDHDHTSGAVRGMVCPRCNSVLSGYDWDKNLNGVPEDYIFGKASSTPSMVMHDVVVEPHPIRGKFIVFEGIDSSGVTTQTRDIAKHIHELMGKTSVVWTREPTDTPLGRLIRQILRGEIKTDGGGRWRPEWDILVSLFAADRMDHINSVIEPSLAAGRNVICDRYIYSMLGYQALTAPYPLKDAYEKLIKLCFGIPEPDLVIVFDIDSNDAAKRRYRAERFRPNRNLYEVESLQYRLFKYYQGLPMVSGAEDLNIPGKCFCHINAARSIESVFADCLLVMKKMWLV